MKHYSEAAVERMMKVREVILRALAKRITWWQAADSGDFGPEHAALAGTLPEARLRRAVGPATGEAQSQAGAGRDRRKGAGAVPGEIFRPQRAALPREAEGGAGDGVELHLGEAGAAG